VPLTGGGKIWLPPGVRAMASRVRRGGAESSAGRSRQPEPEGLARAGLWPLL